MKGSMSLRKVSLIVLLIFATLSMSLMVAPPEAQAETDSDTGAVIVPNGTSPRAYLANTLLEQYQERYPATEFVYMSNFKNPTVVEMTGAVEDDGECLYIKPNKGDSKTGTFTILYSNTASTSKGNDVDVVLEGSVNFHHAVSSGESDTRFFKHGEGSNAFHAPDAHGVQVVITLKLYRHGTYDATTNSGDVVPGVFGMYFSDIDQLHGTDDGYGAAWDEAIQLRDGYVDGYICMGEKITQEHGHINQAGNPSEGKRLDTDCIDRGTGNSDWLTFTASHSCSSMTDSEMAFLVQNGTKFRWSGTRCGSSIGLVGSSLTPDITQNKRVLDGGAESTSTFTSKEAGSVTFVINGEFPYVVNGNKCQSIVLTDTFTAPFDVSSATVVVTKRNNDTWLTCTGNWTKSVSGQKLTLTCDNTATAEGQHKFKITVPFKSGFDFNSLETVTKNGTKYKHTTNVANVTAKKANGDNTGDNTNTVNVYLDFDGELVVHKISGLSDFTSGNSCYSLANAQYKVYKTKADAQAGTNAEATLTTNASGISNTVPVAAGTHFLKETKASPGYAISSTIREFHIASGAPTTVTMEEPPKADSVVLSVAKKSSDTSQNYKLGGARFKVEYYNAHLTAAQVASTTPTRVWYIDTANSLNNLGVGNMNNNLVSSISSATYTRTSGANPVIPLGTVAVTEIAPPSGFSLGSPKTVIYRVNDNGVDTNLGASRSNVSNYTEGSAYTVSVSNVLAPLSTNDPVKPVKEVDKNIATVGEQLTYTVTYNVPNIPSDVRDSYTWGSVAFSDILPKYAAYDEGSFDVYNTDGTCVTPCGTLTVSKSGGRDSLRFVFDSTWLDDGLQYNGGKLKFTFTATVQDPSHTSGYYELINDSTMRINGSDFTSDPVTTKVPVWYIDLTKTSTNPTISASNTSAYTLGGAKFSVKRTDGYIPSPGYITTTQTGSGTSAKGEGSIRVVKPGTYKLQEIVAPKGFAHNDEVKSVTLNSSNYNQHVGISFSNEPLYATRAAQKMDNEYFNIFNPEIDKPFHYEDKADWQGNVPNFSGVTVRARHFGNYSWSPNHTAEAYWSSDNSGYIDIPNNDPSSGTWPYKMHEQNVIPLGSFELVETTAPTGMLVDPTPHRCTIKQVGDRVVVADVS